ncbi:MAG: 3'-5' exonuclease [Anaerolineae bacterium]|nr:3'-5' exonuclease [Anaerolineae bacterium]
MSNGDCAVRLNHLAAVVEHNNFVVLDTETTGLGSDAEIVQLAIIDNRGKVLLDTLLKPTKPIPPDATRIHGITNGQVVAAPSLVMVYPRILNILQGRDVIIYNAEYDRRLLHQSSRAHGLNVLWDSVVSGWTCAMLAYAEHHGEWNPYYHSYKWQKLGAACQQQGIRVVDAHSALADCRMTLALVRRLAGVRA